MLKAFYTASAVLFLLQTSALAQTPEWMDQPKDYSEAAIQTNYSDWLVRKKTEAVEKAANTRAMTEAFDLFGPGVQAMTWSVTSEKQDTTRQGGVSYTCVSDDPSVIPGPFAFSGMSPEEEARICDWRIWQMDFAPPPEIVPGWSSDALNMTTAKAYLKSQNILPDTFGKSTRIDWSGYAPLTARDIAQSVRSQTWSSKNCEGVMTVLSRLEAIGPVQIDIRKFGKERPAPTDMARSDEYRDISVQSGFFTRLEFSGKQGYGVAVTRQIDQVISDCAADS